jgi:hypothetical protein
MNLHGLRTFRLADGVEIETLLKPSRDVIIYVFCAVKECDYVVFGEHGNANVSKSVWKLKCEHCKAQFQVDNPYFAEEEESLDG